MYVCMYVADGSYICIHTYMYVYLYVCIYIHICIHICVYTRMYEIGIKIDVICYVCNKEQWYSLKQYNKQEEIILL